MRSTMAFLFSVFVFAVASNSYADEITAGDFQDFVGNFSVEQANCEAAPETVSISYEQREVSEEPGRWMGPHAILVGFSSKVARYRPFWLEQFSIADEERVAVANFERSGNILVHTFQSTEAYWNVSFERVDTGTMKFSNKCRGFSAGVCQECSLTLKQYF